MFFNLLNKQRVILLIVKITGRLNITRFRVGQYFMTGGREGRKGGHWSMKVGREGKKRRREGGRMRQMGGGRRKGKERWGVKDIGGYKMVKIPGRIVG